MKFPLAASAACACLLLGAPAAKAFTMEDANTGTANGSAGYTDLRTHFDDGKQDNGNQTSQNGVTFQLRSQRPFSERYDQNRLFDPLARDR